MSEFPTTPVPRESPWHAGIRAMRANLVPGIVLWILGLALVLAYYRHPPTHAALEGIIALRERYGPWVPVVLTFLCGGVLPLLYLRTDPDTRNDYRFANCVFLSLFWGYKGFEVDLLYRVLGHVVGTDHSLRTIALKCFLDQGVYCVLYAVPMTVAAYEFNHAGLRFGPLLADFRAGHWYRRRVLSSQIANAAIWVPVVCLVYSLPVSLQTVLFDLVLFFYILLVAHITRRKKH